MDFQKNKVLEEFTNLKWEVKDIVQPQSQNNWKEIEVIQLTKYEISIFLSIDLDPTHRYLGYKKSSSDYDMIMYDFDPLEKNETHKMIGELNLGKGWLDNVERFIMYAEDFLKNTIKTKE
jgi:hypothetical protein